MKNLKLNAKIALIVAAPIYVVFLLALFAIISGFWIIAQFLNITGIVDAFIFLLTWTKKKMTKSEIMEGIDPLQMAAFRDELKKKNK